MHGGSLSAGLAPSSVGLAPSSRAGTQGFLGVRICWTSLNQGPRGGPKQPGWCEQTQGLRGLWGQREGRQGQERGQEQMTALGRKRKR